MSSAPIKLPKFAKQISLMGCAPYTAEI